ncbi:10530_t:CDS:2 [Paraglomus brasilianum]|uniref:10530_t:CDS:1 n=1 Tax=Paraglomus brasilianum TaxID=144538 RepID=A0A9N9G3F0_9GLOM|nr:10530_t:CDS:2 [Paraglomus brasilianum]
MDQRLPPDWKAEYDSNSGQYYYVDTRTGQSQWQPPGDVTPSTHIPSPYPEPSQHSSGMPNASPRGPGMPTASPQGPGMPNAFPFGPSMPTASAHPSSDGYSASSVPSSYASPPPYTSTPSYDVPTASPYGASPYPPDPSTYNPTTYPAEKHSGGGEASAYFGSAQSQNPPTSYPQGAYDSQGTEDPNDPRAFKLGGMNTTTVAAGVIGGAALAYALGHHKKHKKHKKKKWGKGWKWK